jgi:uncharacterized protein
MKQFIKYYVVFSLFFIGQILLAQENIIPEKPSNKKEQVAIYDYAQMLSEIEAKVLEEKLQHYHDSTSTQLVIATIPSLKGNDIEDVAVKWAHAWGIGQEKEDNGLFILIARDDRKIDIEVGYGIEPFLTDGLAKRVIDRVITPSFKQGKYYQGLDRATDVIIDILAGEYQNNNQDIAEESDFPWVFVVIIIIWILIIILGKSNKNNNSGTNRRNGRSISGDIFRSIILSSGGSSGGFGSGGFGGSSGGGGFSGGFGGGGFGGGGASGGW